MGKMPTIIGEKVSLEQQELTGETVVSASGEMETPPKSKTPVGRVARAEKKRHDHAKAQAPAPAEPGVKHHDHHAAKKDPYSRRRPSVVRRK